MATSHQSLGPGLGIRRDGIDGEGAGVAWRISTDNRDCHAAPEAICGERARRAHDTVRARATVNEGQRNRRARRLVFRRLLDFPADPAPAVEVDRMVREADALLRAANTDVAELVSIAAELLRPHRVVETIDVAVGKRREVAGAYREARAARRLHARFRADGVPLDAEPVPLQPVHLAAVQRRVNPGADLYGGVRFQRFAHEEEPRTVALHNVAVVGATNLAEAVGRRKRRSDIRARVVVMAGKVQRHRIDRRVVAHRTPPLGIEDLFGPFLKTRVLCVEPICPDDITGTGTDVIENLVNAGLNVTKDA